jgi:hypothetical protein
MLRPFEEEDLDSDVDSTVTPLKSFDDEDTLSFLEGGTYIVTLGIDCTLARMLAHPHI